MKKTSLALFLLSATAALAQSTSDSESAQPEIPTNLTFDTDIYLVTPSFTLSYGARSLGGTKSSFHGTGRVSSSQAIGPATGSDASRVYNDGTVNVDTRVTTVVNSDGTSTIAAISPDGRTNSWNFTNDTQVVDGNIAMHTYQADVLDGGPRARSAGSTYGVEVQVNHDMGKLLRFDWNLGAGLSLNDVNYKLSSVERANITVVTDTYALNGQTPPTAPYSAPSTLSVNITNADGSAGTTTVDNTTLLDNQPLSRVTTSGISAASVTNHFHIKGAYYTFRAGPTLIIPLTERLRASLSGGAALVYAGTTFDVEQDFVPDTGANVVGTEQSTKTSVLPGFYFDADLEYWLTEHAGLYLGAIYQNTGSFKQSIVSDTADYTTKIDLSSLQGFRMGLNIRF